MTTSIYKIYDDNTPNKIIQTNAEYSIILLKSLKNQTNIIYDKNKMDAEKE